MPLTLATIAQAIAHATDGGTGADALGAPFTTTMVANLAGRHFHSMRQWEWAKGAEAFLDLTGPIAFSGATYTESSKTITKAGAFAGLTLSNHDQVEITAGTGANARPYRIASSTANTIVLQQSIGAAADGQTDIGGTISFPYALLPADCGEVHSVQGQKLSSATLTTLADIATYRSGNTGSFPRAWFACAVSNDSPPAGGPPGPRLEIWPNPNQDMPGELRITYTRDWAELAADDDQAAIPAWCENLYLQVARALARGLEEDDQENMDMRLETIRRGPVFMAAARRDQSQQSSLGMMQHGWAQRDSLAIHTRSGTVSNPS